VCAYVCVCGKLGGVETTGMLDFERQRLEEEIPGVYYRQYLPLSRQVNEQAQ